MPSRNFFVKTSYGAMATAVFASIYVAGTYISRKLSTEELRGPRLTRSMSIAILHGGHIALQRLLECHELRADTSAAEVALCELRTLLSDKLPDYQKLQGDFEEALERKCLFSNVEVSDARRPLYKA